MVARAFLLMWVSRFIPPTDVTSERGPRFVLELWSAVADSLGVTKPQHTTRKPTGCASSFTSHSRPLSAVLLRVCAARLGKTSGILQLVLGQPLRDPGEFMPASPPCFVFQYLYAVSPSHQRLVLHSRCTIACPTLLFCSTACSGLFNQAEAFPFWTLEVGRRLFLLIDLSLHMSC